MTFSVLKRSTAACWAALNVMFNVLVIGPVCIISLGLLLIALPSPGAVFITQADQLIRGAEAGMVWGCDSPPTAKVEAQPALLLQESQVSPFCVNKQVSRADFVTGFNHNLFFVYQLVTLLYAVIYFFGYLMRRQPRNKRHPVETLRAMRATAPVKGGHHE